MTVTVIVSLIGLVFTAIRAYPTVKKIFARNSPRPRIEIELVPISAWSIPMGSSPRNEFTVEKIGGKEYKVINGNTAINVLQLTWEINLFVRNHSDVVAYYPEIKLLADSIFLDIAAGPIKPISNSTEISLNASCMQNLGGKERIGRDRW